MSMDEYPQEYNGHFQRLLLATLVKDEALFKKSRVMELDDLELAPCQVVLESVRDFHSITGRLPDHESLVMHTHKVFLNAEGKYKSFMRPEEKPALDDLLIWIGKTDPVSADYFEKELPSFVKGVRAAKIIDQSRNEAVTGAAADQVIGQLKKLDEDVASGFKEEKLEFVTPAEDPGWITADDWVPPISTGMTKLDMLLSGGVKRKEVGLISAPSGVGKTNLMIHMIVIAAYQWIHGLFFSLELPGKKVRGRASAMVSGIDAKNLLRPIETWDPRDVALLYLAQAHNPIMSRMSFVDSSTIKPTLDSIEQGIIEWKAQKVAAGIKEEMCAEVCIDWVDYVQVPFASKMEDWERYIIVAQELGFIARRQNVHIWIANQTTRAAESKTVMRMGDTARGYHLNDAMDLAIGANIAEESQVRDDNDGVAARGRRHMNLSINKNRDGDLGLVKAFRGPNLRMYNDEQTYNGYIQKTRAVLGPDPFDPNAFDWNKAMEYANRLVLLQAEGLKIEH